MNGHQIAPARRLRRGSGPATARQWSPSPPRLLEAGNIVSSRLTSGPFVSEAGRALDWFARRALIMARRRRRRSSVAQHALEERRARRARTSLSIKPGVWASAPAATRPSRSNAGRRCWRALDKLWKVAPPAPALDCFLAPPSWARRPAGGANLRPERRRRRLRNPVPRQARASRPLLTPPTPARPGALTRPGACGRDDGASGRSHQAAAAAALGPLFAPPGARGRVAPRGNPLRPPSSGPLIDLWPERARARATEPMRAGGGVGEFATRVGPPIMRQARRPARRACGAT